MLDVAAMRTPWTVALVMAESSEGGGRADFWDLVDFADALRLLGPVVFAMAR